MLIWVNTNINLTGVKMARPKKNQFDPQSAQPQQRRNIGGHGEVKSDLFKLDIAACMVNKSYNDAPDLYEQEHIHWFHTFDSDGKKHTRCNAVSGHFHVSKPKTKAKISQSKFYPYQDQCTKLSAV